MPTSDDSAAEDILQTTVVVERINNNSADDGVLSIIHTRTARPTALGYSFSVTSGDSPVPLVHTSTPV